jgi:hypothetical protein
MAAGIVNARKGLQGIGTFDGLEHKCKNGTMSSNARRKRTRVPADKGAAGIFPSKKKS